MTTKSKKDAKRDKIGYRPPARSGRKPNPSACYLDAPVPVPKSALDLLAGQPHRRGLPEGQRLDPLAESSLGRLRLCDKISDEQVEAGRLFALCVGAFRAVFKAPRGVGASSGIGSNCPTGGCGEFLIGCHCQASRDRYCAAYEALAASGRPAVMAVNAVVIQGEPCGDGLLFSLQTGLTALELYFGLRSKSRGSRIVSESYGPAS